MSPAAAAARSTCLVTLKAIGAEDTLSRSRTEPLTAPSNLLVAAMVIVSVTPALPEAGIAICTSSAAVLPEATAMGPESAISPPSSTPLLLTSR